MNQDALLPSILLSTKQRLLSCLLCVALGVVAISLLAQISIRLPMGPVPITGQTFGVALVSLLFGRKLALSTIVSYLTLAGLGAPVLASGVAGLSWGPTLGYLIGMVAASLLVGELADRGWTRSILSAYIAATLGSVLIFVSGLLVLRLFVPPQHLLTTGLLPFIPGDVLKNLLAAKIATSARKIAPHHDPSRP